MEQWKEQMSLSGGSLLKGVSFTSWYGGGQGTLSV